MKYTIRGAKHVSAEDERRNPPQEVHIPLLALRWNVKDYSGRGS